jgi:type 1 glutamine amidotransferase
MEHLMVRTSFAVALFIAVIAYGQDPALSRPTSLPTPKLKVLFITGGEAHDFKKLAPIVTAGIAKFADVDITTRFGRECLKEKNLSDGFDAIVFDMCYNGQEPEEYENLLRITREGKPTVVIHATLHTFKPLPAWSEMLGMTSAVHDPYHAFTTIKLDEKNPITRDWPADWKTEGDELYNTIKVWDSAHPLLKVKSPHDGREHVVAWTNTYGKARIFGTTLGHDEKTANDADYQKLLAKGLLWVCGKLPDE